VLAVEIVLHKPRYLNLELVLLLIHRVVIGDAFAPVLDLVVTQIEFGRFDLLPFTAPAYSAPLASGGLLYADLEGKVEILTLRLSLQRVTVEFVLCEGLGLEVGVEVAAEVRVGVVAPQLPEELLLVLCVLVLPLDVLLVDQNVLVVLFGDLKLDQHAPTVVVAQQLQIFLRRGKRLSLLFRVELVSYALGTPTLVMSAVKGLNLLLLVSEGRLAEGVKVLRLDVGCVDPLRTELSLVYFLVIVSPGLCLDGAYRSRHSNLVVLIGLWQLLSVGRSLVQREGGCYYMGLKVLHFLGRL